MSKMSNFIIKVDEMWSSGYSAEEIADHLNTSLDMVKGALNFDDESNSITSIEVDNQESIIF